jgi:hypothetical protein
LTASRAKRLEFELQLVQSHANHAHQLHQILLAGKAATPSEAERMYLEHHSDEVLLLWKVRFPTTSSGAIL